MKDLAMHVLDIFQNSVVAGAFIIELHITELEKENLYLVTFIDNGKGMDAETVKNVTNPFFTTRTTRKVGLGLPLLKQNAERTGGTMKITSNIGTGTTVEVTFQYSHIDRLPLGDIAGTIALTAASYSAIDFIYKHNSTIGTFTFDTREIKAELGEIPLNTPQVITFMKNFIFDNLREIKAT